MYKDNDKHNGNSGKKNLVRIKIIVEKIYGT